MVAIRCGYVAKISPDSNVRVYLEWDEAERVKGRWLDDGHVISRFNRGASDIRAGAPTDIGHAGSDAVTNDVIDTSAVEAAKEMEGITTSDNYCFCAFDRADRISWLYGVTRPHSPAG